MNIFKHVGDFFLSEWLWSVTWDWYHIPINLVIVCFLLKFMLRINIIPAVLISFAVQIFTLLFHTFLFGVLLHALNLTFDPKAVSEMVIDGTLRACFHVAFVYTILQSIFFVLLSYWYKINLNLAICATALSNMISAYIVYILLPNPLM